jgi:signal transduction histidine kinase
VGRACFNRLAPASSPDRARGVSTCLMTGAIINPMIRRLHLFSTQHPWAADVLLAVILACLVGLASGVRAGASSPGGPLGAAVISASVALPLILRRKSPYISLTGTLVLTIVAFAVSSSVRPPILFPAAVALYTVGTRANWLRVLLVGAAALAVSLTLGFLFTQDVDITEQIAGDVAWVVGSLALGLAVANRRAYVDEIRQRAIQAEQTKEEEAQRRVNEERMRIARDVHDGVAHALASISIQAGAGRAVLHIDPEGADRALQAIRVASVSALSELRSTVGTLRHQGDGVVVEGFKRERVDRLVDVLRAEGIRVSVHGEAYQRPLEGEVGIATHRILQEALTNVLRHSGACEVNISLDRAGDDLVLLVTDDGRGPAKEPGANPGYGLLGMSERATSIGGTFEYGPVPGGGFFVKAVLPVKRRP